MRRLLLIPTFRKLLLAYAVFGMLLAPLNVYVVFFLQDRFGLDSAARGVFFAVANGGGLCGLLLFGRLGERLYRASPARLMTVTSVFQAGGILCLPLAAVAPSVAVSCLLFTVATAVYVSTTPALTTATFNLIDPSMRATASALTSIFTFAVGGPAGLILLGSADQRYGTIVAMSLLTIPGLVSALVIRSAGRTMPVDLDRAADRIVEEEESRALRAAGAHLPLLACRGIDFAYGQVQVLFDVDFTVEDGEAVALLGTNGAGKSTLLRVISGIGLPARGSVRLCGEDITYLDPTRRVGLGITQAPGGRAVFPGLSVVENMRVFAFSHGRNAREIARGIDDSLAAFPRLAERRNQPAGTLSGGEQQMLGLSKALILRPRVLLIDELSLGLAPKVVADLLALVRRINAGGTAVVLVEQSVNIALSLVQHAYFMEKGQVRFDGAASELVERPDLLRSVFLEGASRVAGDDRPVGVITPAPRPEPA